MKRVLVISNNALSNKLNNGLTINSIIKSMGVQEVFQIYVNNEIPDCFCEGHFYQISDISVLKCIFGRKRSGKIVELNEIKSEIVSSKVHFTAKPSELKRIAREMIWRPHKWKNEKFQNWLNIVNPDFIFFVAGDFLGLYDVYEYVNEQFRNTKKIIYITDDYLSKRSSFLFNIRRTFVEKKFKKNVAVVDVFCTISEKMRKEYLERYGFESIVISNISENLQSQKSNKKNTDDIVFLYAGGMHYGRGSVLLEIAKSLLKYPNTKLVIYTSYNKLTLREKNDFLFYNNVELNDSISREQLIGKYKDADILVFVESFEPQNVECTRLSFSTKITEYLSLGKMIFGVGPKSSGSIEYLQDCCLVCNEINSISRYMDILLDDKQREKYGILAHRKYECHHSSKVIEKKVSEIVNGLNAN